MKKQTKRLLWIGIPIALVLVLLLCGFLFVKSSYPNTTGLGHGAFICWNEEEGMLFTPGGIWKGEIYKIGNQAYAAYSEKRETLVVFGQGATWPGSYSPTRYTVGNVFHGTAEKTGRRFRAEKLIIAEGITKLSAYTLDGIGYVRDIYIASTVQGMDSTNSLPSSTCLRAVYYLGNATDAVPFALSGDETDWIKAYCLPGTSGWDTGAWQNIPVETRRFSVDWGPA